MNRNCKCGGRFQRSDLKRVFLADGRTGFADTDTKVASWACDKCGDTRTQAKRQPRAATPGWNERWREGDILIVDAQHVIGPFPDEEQAQAWLDAPHRVGQEYLIVRLHAFAGIGNAETAHHCGTTIGGGIIWKARI